MRYLTLLSVSIIFTLLSTTCLAEKLPYRKDYPQAPIIELADLKAGYDKGEFIIVDVRSALEFETIHVKKAVHIPMSNILFERKLKVLSAKNPGKKIAVYCNGITSIKSYNAVERAVNAGMHTVYAFDAGIPSWANAYPTETLLLGKEIINPGKQLIPKKEFKKVCLDFETFMKKAAAGNAVVLDTRDAIQRTKDLPGLGGVRPIPLDKLNRNVVSKGMLKENSLLIFDQAGTQVKWLMYLLRDQGYADFYFLKGGATSVLKEQKYRRVS